jgi:pimeloyl-ACP methyl ester carboxylesterase
MDGLRPAGGVLLLHGHGRSGASMGILGAAFREAGYRILAPSYGMRRPMPAILDLLAPKLRAFEAGFDGPLHIVTHSLGGLVARALIHAHRPTRLGRVVMLAPPNCGSELADLLDHLGLGEAVLGPVARQLLTRRGADEEKLLGVVDYELGIVAGNRSLSPYVPARILPRPHDGKVSVAATKLDGMVDHVVVPVPHALMVHHPKSIAQALAFIETGAFRR